MCFHSFVQPLIKLLALLLPTAASCQRSTAVNLWHYATIDLPQKSNSREESPVWHQK